MFNARWTIALWVILIILFVAFYQIFRGPRGAETAPPPEVSAPRDDFDVLAIVPRILPLVFLVVLALYFMLGKKMTATSDGVSLLGQGRYLQALEQFEIYRKAFSNQPIGAFNCGVTRLQLWKLEAALADFSSAQKLMTATVPMLSVLIPEHLALTHAILGRAGDARAALAAIPAEKGDPGRMGLATAILLAREGRWADARSKLGSFEVKQLSGTIGALSRTLDSLCIEQLTQETRHVDRVALFGEAAPDELRKHWPELIAFVERAPAW